MDSRPYFQQNSLAVTAPHHESVKALWELKWQKLSYMKDIYPFVDGKGEDFEIVFQSLISMNLKEPWDPDQYAGAFFPVAEKLEAEASAAASKGDGSQASELYLRAAALYRISRFPIPCSPLTHAAWDRGKAAYLKGVAHLDPPNEEVFIPHVHGTQAEKDKPIIVYVRTPPNASPSNPVPVLIFICGLDAYRTDHRNRTTEHVRRGFATVSVEIPGTGDAPGEKSDPTSPDRMWSSLLDWVASQREFDTSKVCARGVSTGGYYAMRIAHTHADRLLAVVSQGGGCHYMFNKDWIDAQNRMEYPFGLAEALALKFGYDSVEAYAKDAQKRFSLLELGILDMPSCRLCLINGMKDEIFPIEDSMLLLRHGSPKDARFFDNRYHVGNPGAEEVVYDWLDQFK